MKTLFLLRHADAAPGRDYPTDSERPLTRRGRADAQRTGRFLTTIDQIPDRAVTSTATRARQTLAQAREAGGWPNRVLTDDMLYEARAHDVLAVARDTPDSADTLLLVGHNPTFTDAVVRLIGGGNVRMAPGTIARIDLILDAWAEVQFERGRLTWLTGPNHLPR